MNILGYDYELTEEPGAKFIDRFGQHDVATQTIAIVAGMPEQLKVSTILHEVLHALNCHLGLELEHHKITALETGLYQVLTQNGVDLRSLIREV